MTRYEWLILAMVIVAISTWIFMERLHAKPITVHIEKVTECGKVVELHTKVARGGVYTEVVR